MATRSQFVNEVYEAAKAAGLTDAAARVMAAQAAHESGFGESAPGYNYFGIKAGSSWDGKTNTLTTHEIENGKRVKTKAKFRAYDSPEEAVADRIAFMADKFPAFNQAATVGDALDALQNGKFGKYYTDSRSAYEGSINDINSRYLGGTPVPPGSIPDVASEIDTGRGGYTIKSGDTLGELARKFGTSVDALARANGITDPNKIFAGQSLTLPGSDRPTTQRQPPATPQSLIPGPGELPPRASYWQEQGGWPSTLNTTTEAETRGEQRALGARGQGPSLGFNPLPAPPPLVPQSGPAAPTPRSLPLAPGPVAPMPRQRPGVPAVAPSGGGFLGGLGDALGGGLNFLGSKAQEAGTALGNTANRVVTGTGQALNDSAAAAKDILADKLLGTVAGRTLLFNTLTGTTPAMKPEERAQQRAASAPEGYGFGPNGKTLYKIGQVYNSSRGPVTFNGTGFTPAQTAVKTQVSVQPSTAMQTRQAQQEDWARRGLNEFGMLS